MRWLCSFLSRGLSTFLWVLAVPALAEHAGGVVSIQSIHDGGAWLGRRVVTEGAVTLVTPRGFFLQQLGGANESRVSRGLFVFTGGAPGVVARQCVRLAGRVGGYGAGPAVRRGARVRLVTELRQPSDLRVLRADCEVVPVELTWPLAAGEGLERVEGMVVTGRGPWTVQQVFFPGGSRQVVLATGGRVQAPTNLLRPGAAARALARVNALRSVVVAEGVSPSWLGEVGALRAGDTLDELTGVVDPGLASAPAEGASRWTIRPLRPPRFVRANPRTPAPAPVGGDLRVAAANVDNFFSTLADGRHGCGPRHVVADCRGARDAAAFERQRAKIVEMLAAIDADVVALMEIENNGATALQSLVDALNVRVGAPAWVAVDEAASAGGGDAIRVALIYKPARVLPVGPARVDRHPAHSRPPLAQTFTTADGALRFNVIASHFKSRRCDGATGAERDRGDLQGCWNLRRITQARALVRFAGEVARASKVDATLLVGDFNAYAREDPPTLLAASGFADQVARFDPDAYSYVYDGAAGRLDGVFASASLARRMTGVTAWHVDADEPSSPGDALASRVRGAPADALARTATPWRASDHDPMIVGLRLADP